MPIQNNTEDTYTLALQQLGFEKLRPDSYLTRQVLGMFATLHLTQEQDKREQLLQSYDRWFQEQIKLFEAFLKNHNNKADSDTQIRQWNSPEEQEKRLSGDGERLSLQNLQHQLISYHHAEEALFGEIKMLQDALQQIVDKIFEEDEDLKRAFDAHPEKDQIRQYVVRDFMMEMMLNPQPQPTTQRAKTPEEQQKAAKPHWERLRTLVRQHSNQPPEESTSDDKAAPPEFVRLVTQLMAAAEEHGPKLRRTVSQGIGALHGLQRALAVVGQPSADAGAGEYPIHFIPTGVGNPPVVRGGSKHADGDDSLHHVPGKGDGRP